MTEGYNAAADDEISFGQEHTSSHYMYYVRIVDFIEFPPIMRPHLEFGKFGVIGGNFCAMGGVFANGRRILFRRSFPPIALIADFGRRIWGRRIWGRGMRAGTEIDACRHDSFWHCMSVSGKPPAGSAPN